MPTDPCKSVKDEVTRLQEELQAEKSNWQPHNTGGGGPRHPAAGMIRQLENEYRPRIQAKQREYEQCRFDNGGKPDLPVTLAASVRMTTTKSEAPGPYNKSITLGLTFLKFEHKTLSITSFPSISVTFDTGTPLGSNTTTITNSSVEPTSVNPANGRMTISLTLHFHQSLLDGQDSDVSIELSTENSGGSRINRSNRLVILAGTGTFEDGFLDGEDCTLVIRGTLSALP
jgi:hypothetical protein